MALSLNKRDLTKYDLELLIDVSGSTANPGANPRQTRLEEALKIAQLLVEEMDAIDDDGITIGLFDSTLRCVAENTTKANAHEILGLARPGSRTDTAGALQSRIDDYFGQRFGSPAVTESRSVRHGLHKQTETVVVSPAVPADPTTKPRVIVIVTDGEPNDETALENVIIQATRRLTAEGLGREALGISFIQVGTDAQATTWLKRLDDGLCPGRGATLDIVNCLTIDDAYELSTREILEAALDD